MKHQARSRGIILAFLLISVFSDSIAQVYTDSLKNIFEAYRSKNFDEKVFLHTDRSSYFTGEIIWFKIYHVDASFHKPFAWSEVLYVELIGGDHKPVLQSKYSLRDTTTTGSIFLPAALNSGNYELIAYTRWMRNSDPKYFFRQTIRIINPFVERTNEIVKTPENDVQFFPEGGNLVYGLESVVGVRVAGSDGQGADFRGAIIDDQKDTVARFRPVKFGLAKFVFTPEKNQVYEAVITDSKKRQFKYTLPPIAEQGYVMKVSELMTKIKITVNTRQENSGPIYLLAHTRQQNVSAQEQNFSKGEAVFMIDKKKLADGVSHFTIFDKHLIPVCERLWFRKPVVTLDIDAKIDKPVFSPRQKADLEIRCQENNDMTSVSNLSVVVYKADSLDLPVDNLLSYLMLTSDLAGNIEHAEYYFGEESPILSEATDNLMLTHGWRRFVWKNILEKKYPKQYIPELGGHIVTGRVINKVSIKPVKQVRTYLTFAGSPANVFISRSDSAGRIMFESELGMGSRNLVIQTDDLNRKEYQIELDNPFHSDLYLDTPEPFSLSRSMKASVQQRSIHMQIHSSFHPEISVTRKKIPGLPFYGKADEHYLLDDYTRFPTLEEVMREYVPGVRVSKVKGHFQLTNLDIINKLPFKDSPLVLLDGVPIFDMDALMEIDPLKIKALDVLTKRYYLQAANFDGVISLTSYKDDLAGFQPPVEALLSNYMGFEKHREFFTPRYETEKQVNTTVPDVRYVLYRSPDKLATSGDVIKLNFFTSDITGEFKIVIQALSDQGVPGYYSSVFSVK